MKKFLIVVSFFLYGMSSYAQLQPLLVENMTMQSLEVEVFYSDVCGSFVATSPYVTILPFTGQLFPATTNPAIFYSVVKGNSLTFPFLSGTFWNDAIVPSCGISSGNFTAMWNSPFHVTLLP